MGIGTHSENNPVTFLADKLRLYLTRPKVCWRNYVRMIIIILEICSWFTCQPLSSVWQIFRIPPNLQQPARIMYIFTIFLISSPFLFYRFKILVLTTGVFAAFRRWAQVHVGLEYGRLRNGGTFKILPLPKKRGLSHAKNAIWWTNNARSFGQIVYCKWAPLRQMYVRMERLFVTPYYMFR